MLASTNGLKDLFEDGEVSLNASAMGTTTTVRLEKQSELRSERFS